MDKKNTVNQQRRVKIHKNVREDVIEANEHKKCLEKKRNYEY